MKVVKSVAIAALGLAVGLGGATAAMAKGHDQGVADGTPRDDTGLFSRKGAVAGVNVAGIGAEAFGGECGEGLVFCGVVGDPGQTYGRTIVTQQREAGIRRVTPVVNGRK